jgi:hypothetical protein
MIAEPEIDLMVPVTDGEIAINNLDGTRQYSWNRFWCDPQRPGIAETVVEQEQFVLENGYRIITAPGARFLM